MGVALVAVAVGIILGVLEFSEIGGGGGGGLPKMREGGESVSTPLQTMLL